MNVRQKIESLIQKDYFDTSITHEEKWEALINALGRKACISWIALTKTELQNYYERDKHFNNWKKYPLEYWDKIGKRIFQTLGRQIGITSYSLSDCVCLSKTIARIKINK